METGNAAILDTHRKAWQKGLKAVPEERDEVHEWLNAHDGWGNGPVFDRHLNDAIQHIPGQPDKEIKTRTRGQEWHKEDSHDAAVARQQALHLAMSPRLSQKIDDTSLALSKRLGIPAKGLASMLTYWVKHVPQDERADMLQTLGLALLQYRPNQSGLAFAVCAAQVKNWWRAYQYRQHYSLEAATTEDGVSKLSDVLASEVRFEAQIEGNIVATQIWEQLPDKVRPAVRKRLRGVALSDAERQSLSRFLRTRPMFLSDADRLSHA